VTAGYYGDRQPQASAGWRAQAPHELARCELARCELDWYSLATHALARMRTLILALILAVVSAQV